jgi:hypothetical protein
MRAAPMAVKRAATTAESLAENWVEPKADR